MPHQPQCQHCRQSPDLDFQFTMAFQPIVRLSDSSIYAHEALVRGPEGQGAAWVLDQVNDQNRYRFDQQCRVKAIELAAKLKMTSKLSINFLPRAVYQPASCLRATVQAAEQFQFDLRQLMFEFVETERVDSINHIRYILEHYRECGFTLAIDDFGSGYSGLDLLVNFQTDIVKLDRELIIDIHQNTPRQVVVRHCVAMLKDMGIEPLAEGIECEQEAAWLADLGVDLMQGYWFAKPGFECLPQVTFLS